MPTATLAIFRFPLAASPGLITQNRVPLKTRAKGLATEKNVLQTF